MNRKRTYFIITLILTLISLSLLISGSSVLTMPLDREGTIPLGTLITWAGMISLPATVYWGIGALRKPTGKVNRLLSGFLKIILLLGVLWVPISYFLAGNLSFSFSEKESFQGGQQAMQWFWRLSYAIPIGTFLTLVLY
jgi:hypothetical protein